VSDLSSDAMPSETIAAEVARAASGMTNSALARAAGLSNRTLRAILDPHTTRRFGRATLDKLDKPLGWRQGRAWTIYAAQYDLRDMSSDHERIESITIQMQLMNERINQFADRPPWMAELIEACRDLTDEDRAHVLALARRLGGSPRTADPHSR
jgi:plasmid maintenance system antidote protein VapI